MDDECGSVMANVLVLPPELVSIGVVGLVICSGSSGPGLVLIWVPVKRAKMVEASSSVSSSSDRSACWSLLALLQSVARRSSKSGVAYGVASSDASGDDSIIDGEVVEDDLEDLEN